MKIWIMHMTSHYVVMFFWTAVYVRTQDPPALNSSSVENNNNTDATPPLCLPIGDNPDPTCYTNDVFISSMIDDTIPMPSSVVTESVLATIFSTTAFIPATLGSKPEQITPTVHQSPNSPEDTKFITETPTQSPMTVGKMVHKNQEDGWNATESTNCAFDPCVDLQDTCFNRPHPTCICPGVTSDSQPPDRPTSFSVTAVTHSVVLVKWCAPYSTVLEYLFVVRHEGLVQKNLSISSAVRQVFISDLTADHIYHICVQAVNGAGSSGPKCASVWMGLNTEVYLYSLLAVCGVLMVIVATLSFCLYKQCKKTPVENLHLTRLISIPNPAFFNP